MLASTFSETASSAQKREIGKAQILQDYSQGDGWYRCYAALVDKEESF